MYGQVKSEREICDQNEGNNNRTKMCSLALNGIKIMRVSH